MNKYLTLGLSLLPVVVIFIGMIGWIFTLRADLDTVIEAWERDNVEVVLADTWERIGEIEQIQAIQKNEMESIMAGLPDGCRGDYDRHHRRYLWVSWWSQLESSRE